MKCIRSFSALLSQAQAEYSRPIRFEILSLFNRPFHSVKDTVVMNTPTNKSSQFFEAVKKNDLETVDALLSAKEVAVDLKNPEEKHRTALHTAAHENYHELVCLLVDKHQADVNITDQEGRIPLQLATDRYYMKNVKFLLKRGSTLREYAARHLNSDQIEEIFEAVRINNIDRVAELLDAGVDIDSEDLSDLHQTALEIAADKGYYDLVKVLVSRNADINHEDDIDESAYDKAVNRDHENIANFLLEQGYKDRYTKDESNSDSDIDIACLDADYLLNNDL